ncbi:MAG: hypothetical protein QG632_370 [Candidatus Dependentiae bacterium]|nr:hypothetical protein [Candidatus Dependentiae bacterium]
MKNIMLALVVAGLTASVVVAEEQMEQVAQMEQMAVEQRDIVLFEVAVDTAMGTVDVTAEVIPSADLVATADASEEVAVATEASREVCCDDDAE